MRKFIVNVNGTNYEVGVEEMTGAPVQSATAAPVAPAAPASNAAGESVTSPMPGNILQVNVQPGAMVKSGQVMFILEAMKMENEIVAPKDGKVVALNVQKGATVNSGDVLAVIQ